VNNNSNGNDKARGLTLPLVQRLSPSMSPDIIAFFGGLSV